MAIAPLPECFRQYLSDRFTEAGTVIADHHLNAFQAPFLEADQKLSPGTGTLLIGQLNAQDLSATIPVYANGNFCHLR